MSGPGARANAALARALTSQLREHVFDPIVADMQLEHDAARARGCRVQAAWIRTRGRAHLLEALLLVLALDVLQSARRGLWRFGVATTVAALLTFWLFLGLATLTRDAAVRDMTILTPPIPGSAAPLAEDLRARERNVR